jgi:hypothetical protein
MLVLVPAVAAVVLVPAPAVTVIVFVLVVYCTVVRTPWITCVTMDQMVDVVQLVVVVKIVVVTVTFGAC